jgi:general secretion pathway protein G
MKRINSILNNHKGFTLVEIILVVIIIGVIAAMVMPNLQGQSSKAKRTAARVDIETNIAAALDIYEVENGMYPSTSQGLKALLVKPSSSPAPNNWDGPYLKKKRMPVDPWGNPYVYISPGIQNKESYDLSSHGPDGVESDDDIVNWFSEEDLSSFE